MSQSETGTDLAPETEDALTEEELWAQGEEETEEPDQQPEGEDHGEEVQRQEGQGLPSDQEGQQDVREREGQEAPVEEPEWWKSLPDEARNEIQETFAQQERQFNEMQHRFQSLQGRVAPTQRELEKTRREYAALQKQLEAVQSPASIEELESTEVFKELASDFPDEADALKKAVVALVAQKETEAKAKLDYATRALVEERQARAERERSRLAQAHPDWEVWSRSQEFALWRSYLPPDQQQEVQKMLASPYADENIEVLNAFKRDLEAVKTQPSDSQPQSGRTSQQASTGRRKPPSPSPTSEGSGISGSRRAPVSRSEEDLWAEVGEDDLEAFRRRAL